MIKIKTKQPFNYVSYFLILFSLKFAPRLLILVTQFLRNFSKCREDEVNFKPASWDNNIRDYSFLVREDKDKGISEYRSQGNPSEVISRPLPMRVWTWQSCDADCSHVDSLSFTCILPVDRNVLAMHVVSIGDQLLYC